MAVAPFFPILHFVENNVKSVRQDAMIQFASSYCQILHPAVEELQLSAENESSPRGVKITGQQRDGTDGPISSRRLLRRSHRSCDETKWWNYNAMSNVCVCVWLRGCLRRLGYDTRVGGAASRCCHFKKIKRTSQSLPQHLNVSVLSAPPTWCGGDKKCHAAVSSALWWQRGCPEDTRADTPRTRSRQPGDSLQCVGELLQQWGEQASCDKWVWDAAAPKQHGLTDEINDVVLGLVSLRRGLSSRSLLRWRQGQWLWFIGAELSSGRMWRLRRALMLILAWKREK